MRVGSLFTGYGGLDMAVGGDLAWYAEVEPAACKVLAAHYPGVPNLGDITQVDWSAVEPVDVITGGYPCQPFSTAGKRKGKDDERHLWPYVRDAIGAIRPRWAVLENVRGHLSLGFADVLADLADLGVSARWGVVRAADAGAPHNRARLFIVADTDGERHERAGSARDGWAGLAHGNDDATDAEGTKRRGAKPDDLQKSRSHGLAGKPTELGERAGFATDASGERHGRGQRPASLGRVGGASEGSGRQASTTRQEPGTGSVARWGDYAPAIDRWQTVIGRPAPAPTVRRNDRDRLSPAFVEWMMGLPEGHVTGHGLSPSAELKMLGNGVVPQQARLALQLLGGVA
jgi:DNA (cytosine-5)-methyltransferase 1